MSTKRHSIALRLAKLACDIDDLAEMKNKSVYVEALHAMAGLCVDCGKACE